MLTLRSHDFRDVLGNLRSALWRGAARSRCAPGASGLYAYTIMRIVVAAAALALSACTTVTPFVGPNGKPAHHIDCGSSQQNCMLKAGELCPSGYEVIDRKSGMVAAPVWPAGFVMAEQIAISVQCRQ